MEYGEPEINGSNPKLCLASDQRSQSGATPLLLVQQMEKMHPSFLTVLMVSFIAIVFPAFLEVGAAACASATFFTGYGLFWTLMLLPFLLWRPSLLRFGFYALLIGSLVILYLVQWNSRKHFLRDFDKVQIGMTVSEVESIMGGYMKGTGWQIPDSTSPSGQLTEVGSGITMATSTSRSGELEIQDSITYRHSDDGAFNSDWGVVKFKNGKVVGKRFMPD